MRHLQLLGAPLALALALVAGPPSHGEVVLDWDEWGVAHVQAPDLSSAAYGNGWAQMEARGQTIAMGYLNARGEAAACLGETMLPVDLRVRQLGVPERAQSWLAAQDPEVTEILRGFTAGMNAWLDAHPERQGALACLGRVRPTDSLAFLQLSLHVAVVAFNIDGLTQTWRETRGSNAYAIAPSQTVDGRSLLLINPHSAWSAPFLSFETHLITPDLNIYGMTFPGLPLPFAGFTDDHGWALTFNDIDGLDLYNLTLDGAGYRYGGETRAFTTRTVEIGVKTGSGQVEIRPFTVKESVQGPVIAEAPGRVLAVRIAGLDRPELNAQLLGMWRARDLPGFKAAMSRQQIPITNTVYANAGGDIFYVFNGLSPRRSRGDRDFWQGVVDGSDPTLVWTDYLPFDALPQATNPTSGRLQNANDGPTSSSLPAMIDLADFDPVLTADRRTPRGRRSLRQLSLAGPLSLDSLGLLRASSVMDSAELAAPALARAATASPDAGVRRLGEILAGWDRSAGPDSQGAVLFADWVFRMGRAGTPLVKGDLQHLSALAVDQPLADPVAALAQLKESGAQLTKLFGSADVAWGRVYRIRRAGLDLPSPVGRDELGAFNAGHYRRVSQAGPDQGMFLLEDGSHFIAEVAFGASGPEARGLLTYGNFDDDDGPGVRRQLQMFSRSQMRAMRFDLGSVQAGSQTRTVLSAPSGER